MPVMLRTALRETLEDWKDEVPAPWRSVFSKSVLAYEDVADDLWLPAWVPIFPTVRSPGVLGAPRVASTFRALAAIDPSEVRVVVVGQDPYPDVAKATGQAFEQGDLRSWTRDSHRVSPSLKRILQSAVAEETGEDVYRAKGGWQRTMRDLGQDSAQLSAPADWFAGTNREGVLWLNTTLTISLFRVTPSHQLGHAACWRPFVLDLFRELVADVDRKLVFALFGGWARDFREVIVSLAGEAGTNANVRVVEKTHPARYQFLHADNPFSRVNEELAELEAEPVDWLPG